MKKTKLYGKEVCQNCRSWSGGHSRCAWCMKLRKQVKADDYCGYFNF